MDFSVLSLGQDVRFDRAVANQAAGCGSRQPGRVTDSLPLERLGGFVPLADVFFEFSVGPHADVAKRLLVRVVAGDEQRLPFTNSCASEHKAAVENPFARCARLCGASLRRDNRRSMDELDIFGANEWFQLLHFVWDRFNRRADLRPLFRQRFAGDARLSLPSPSHVEHLAAVVPGEN